MRKNKIRSLINLVERNGLENSINRLQARFKYLKSKNYQEHISNQMRYIKFHLQKLTKTKTIGG